jgi:regulator of protease activity HflC (stomatin/prohibitin superfamily)
VRTRRLALLGLCALSAVACGTTNSTEVGVRTSMFGIIEKRGTMQVYPPGGVYFILPVLNTWNTLPISQQNLAMTDSVKDGDRPVPDSVTFKTKDGNNIHIDVNVMWRVDPQKAPHVIKFVGASVTEIKERLVRPVSRSVIRDVFNEITSEEYYHVTTKNETAAKAKDQLARELQPYGILVDMLQVQQHRFDSEYQAAINAQKQAEADVQMLMEQQKNVEVQKKSELEGKRSQWNKEMEDAMGEAGRVRNEADAYYQTKTNEAQAVIARAQAEAEGVKKEAEALGKLGGDAYVKMQVARQLATKRMMIVPGSNVSTMDVNQMVNYLVGKQQQQQQQQQAKEEVAPTVDTSGH